MRGEVPEHVDVGLDEAEVDAHRVDVLDVAELRRRDELADRTDRRGVAVRVVAHQHEARARRPASTSAARRRPTDASGFSTSTCLPASRHAQRDRRRGSRPGSRSRRPRPRIGEHRVEVVGDADACCSAPPPARPGRVDGRRPTATRAAVCREVADQVRPPVPRADDGDTDRLGVTLRVRSRAHRVKATGWPAELRPLPNRRVEPRRRPGTSWSTSGRSS